MGSGLDLPPPERSRILRELAADLEDLYRAYRAQGLGEAEAERRAEAVLGPDARAMHELAWLHRPLYRRLVDRFSDRTRHRV